MLFYSESFQQFPEKQLITLKLKIKIMRKSLNRLYFCLTVKQYFPFLVEQPDRFV